MLENFRDNIEEIASSPPHTAGDPRNDNLTLCGHLSRRAGLWLMTIKKSQGYVLYTNLGCHGMVHDSQESLVKFGL